jgi:hypothetical protein
LRDHGGAWVLLKIIKAKLVVHLRRDFNGCTARLAAQDLAGRRLADAIALLALAALNFDGIAVVGVPS